MVFDESDAVAALLPDEPLPVEALVPDDELLALRDESFEDEPLLSALSVPELSLGGPTLNEPVALTSTLVAADVLTGPTLASTPESADAAALSPALAAPNPEAAPPSAKPAMPATAPCPPPIANAGAVSARGAEIAAEITNVDAVLPK